MSVTPARENFVLMPEGTDIIMYIVLAPFAAVFLYGLYLRLGSYDLRLLWMVFKSSPGGFIRSIIEFAWAQRRILRDARAGIMHLLISYGILVLFIGTTLVFVDHDILRPLKARLLVGDFYLVFEILLDAFGLLLIAGLAYALLRRTVTRPSRLSYRREYLAILWLLLFIGVTGFVLEGIRIYLRSPPWSIYSPVGALLAAAMGGLNVGGDVMMATYRALWWVHAVASFAGVAALPFTNLLHILAASLNVAANKQHARTPGLIETPFILSKLDLEAALPPIGISSINDFKPRQILQIDACTDCGRCDEVCPALIAGTPLSPRMIVQKLRRVWWERRGDDLFDSGVFTLEEVYACTTCGACEYACPALISPMELIVELRRALALRGIVTRKGVETLSNLARARNPLGLGQGERIKLLEELAQIGVRKVEDEESVETIYWIGCMGAYDPRAREVVKQIASLLASAGVKFAVMCSEEVCNGDPARRLGEEGRYQELAEEVINLMKSKGVKEVITHCPHCFDIFSRQYRDLGAEFKVVSHIQLLQRLVREGKLKPAAAEPLTIHDSCIFSRMHGLVEEPREVLSGSDVREPRRGGRMTMCCGAGGGNYWLDIKRVKRENLLRLEELMETGATTVVTECPFCLAMLEDARRVLGVEDRISVKDISELLRPAGKG
ncbi:Lactate utilization protein A [Candidatus Calditenuaceae archaeon HR02]|nr:Lactate utilization protein A [Candidatus Calditenuaceae archaeon HR02]